MKRTNVYLSNEQLTKLFEVARKLNISMAEAVRRAVDRYLEEMRKHFSK